MNILFITRDLIAGNLAYLLKKEGNNVKLFIEEKARRNNLDNLVKKTNNWRKELKWVGKDGLIVFDDVGYGKIQDKLRYQGYTVFGGCEFADKLEGDREYGQKIFKECGLETVELKDFLNMEDAVIYAKEHKKAWVIKQNDHASKSLNYVGHFGDGRDVISMLKNYLQNKSVNQEKITLHERIRGIEIGVGRYFNGHDWVGPIEFNVEHKKLFPGDVGPTTSEMGTLAWYDDNEDNKLYKETLAKLKPYLEKINFKGDMEINCIVNETGAHPLEATPRMGSPIVHLHSEIHSSPWGEFLYAIASGKNYNLKWKKGYGIVAVIAVPPFPYSSKTSRVGENLFYGLNIYFDNLLLSDFDHIHYEETSLRTGNEHQLYISDNRGYVMYVTEMGKTVEEAQKKVYALIKKVVIPKMFYRNDLGQSFIDSGCDQLKKWGYL